MRLKYTTGLDADQFEEVVARVEELLPEPWNKPRGRKRKLSLVDAVALTVSYLRQNSIQEVLRERWSVSQDRVSELTSYLTPLVETAMEEFAHRAGRCRRRAGPGLPAGGQGVGTGVVRWL